MVLGAGAGDGRELGGGLAEPEERAGVALQAGVLQADEAPAEPEGDEGEEPAGDEEDEPELQDGPGDEGGGGPNHAATRVELGLGAVSRFAWIIAR